MKADPTRCASAPLKGVTVSSRTLRLKVESFLLNLRGRVDKTLRVQRRECDNYILFQRIRLSYRLIILLEARILVHATQF